MNPWIVWAGVAALAIICFTIIAIVAAKNQPPRQLPPMQAPRRWESNKTYYTDDLPQPVSDPENPKYGIKENKNNG